MNHKTQKKVLRYSFILYLLSTFILIISAMVLRREYQDSWALEGLFFHILFFSLTFLIVAVNITDNMKLIFFISSFLAILSAIPNLKYAQIYGVFDPIAHYGYINRLISLGHTPETGFYANEYSCTPGMHIFIAAISLVTGFSTTVTIKLFLIVISLMSPFFIHLVTKVAFSKDAEKFILLALYLSLPISYILTGRTIGLTMYLFFIMVFLRQNIIKQSSKRFTAILIIVGISIIISHGVSSLFLSILMACVMFLLIISILVGKVNFNRIVSRYLHISFFFSVLLLTYWIYNARYLFNKFLIEMLKSLFEGRSTALIPSKFYQLSFYEQLALFYIRFYDLCIIMFLSLIGLFFYLTAFRKNCLERTKTLYLNILYIAGATVLIAAPFFFKFQIYTLEERFINYSMLLSPFFVGLGLYSIDKYLQLHIKGSIIRKLLFVLFLFLVLISLLPVKFIYQPILPYSDEKEYIIDYRSVNTIYQVQMIRFAEKHHVNGSKISSDSITAWQIFGLTAASFHSCYTWHNPLYENYAKNSMILLHYSGRSGALHEPVEYRTKTRLNEFKIKLCNNVIYDNGESFIIGLCTK